MRSRRITTLLAIAALATAATAVAAPAALAGPNEDFSAVGKDYLPDQKITPCAFTRAQLVNALGVADSYGADADYYAPGLRDGIRAEIARWDKGGCTKTTKDNPAVAVFGSGAWLKLTVVNSKGPAAKETVIFKNIGTRTIPVNRLRLVVGGRQIRLPSYSLTKGHSFRTVAGCAKNSTKRKRIKATLYECRKSQFLSDAGGLVQLDAGNTVLSQFGYGSSKSKPRF
jgi:hypothetical protein